MSKKDSKIYSSFKDMALDSDEPILNDKIKKNYFRLYLNKTDGAPMILSGKYKRHDNHMVTITNIKPYIKGRKTRIITQHVNIPIKQFENVVDISTLVRDHKYYFICYCRPYNNGSGRFGVALATDVTPNSFFSAGEIQNILTDKIINKCFKFSLDDFCIETNGKLSSEKLNRGLVNYMDDINTAPVILIAKYRGHDETIVKFSGVRPYIDNLKTYVIYSSIEIPIKDIESFTNVETMQISHEYILICRCFFKEIVDKENKEKGFKICFSLAYELCNTCFIDINNALEYITSDIINLCYKFDPNIFLKHVNINGSAVARVDDFYTKA